MREICTSGSVGGVLGIHNRYVYPTGINNIIQNIKCRARGYRNSKYFETIIYLVQGELDIAGLLVRS